MEENGEEEKGEGEDRDLYVIEFQIFVSSSVLFWEHIHS